MNSCFGLSKEDLSLLIAILQQAGVRGKVFGSRVRGSEKKFSDLDLCLVDEVSFAAYAQLQEAFEESSLPIVVDLSRYEDLNASFKDLVDREGILIP